MINPTHLNDEEAVHYAYAAFLELNTPQTPPPLALWIERLLAIIKSRDEELKAVRAKLHQVLDDLDNANARD